MATLEEIRKRIKQQQQDKNADAVSQLSTDEKKRKLERLKELLTRLKRGRSIRAENPCVGGSIPPRATKIH